MQKEEMKETKKRSKISVVIEYVINVALIFACVFWVPEHVMQRTTVKGSSMTNTLYHEENLLVNKLEYKFADPERYEIVIFHPFGLEKEKLYIKRVYGLPGETIQIKGDDIYINGEKIEDGFAKNGTKDPGIAEQPITLGEDEYFVLGDNRQGSTDSRDPSVGLVKRENITGHAVLRIWPLSQFGLIK